MLIILKDIFTLHIKTSARGIPWILVTVLWPKTSSVDFFWGINKLVDQILHRDMHIQNFESTIQEPRTTNEDITFSQCTKTRWKSLQQVAVKLVLQLTWNLWQRFPLWLLRSASNASSAFFLLSSTYMSSIIGFQRRTRAFINQLETYYQSKRKGKWSQMWMCTTIEVRPCTWLRVKPLFIASKCFSLSFGYLRSSPLI